MSLPKVKFVEIPIKLEIDWIYGFLFDNEWGWGNRIIKKHPDLKPIYKLSTERERVFFLRKYLFDFKRFNRRKLLNKKKRFEKSWRRIEKYYLIELEKILNINWLSNKKEIKAMISLNPICPRFLDKWSFSLYFDYKIKDAMETIMHETCHFLYFKKWKELFPNAERKTFDYPHVEWHLSEILAPIILNDNRIQKYLKQKAIFYNEHKKIEIDGVNAPRYFSKLYNSYLKNDKNFADFLKEAYRIIKRHKKKFLTIGKK